jgi:hypothetical protein
MLQSSSLRRLSDMRSGIDQVLGSADVLLPADARDTRWFHKTTLHLLLNNKY